MVFLSAFLLITLIIVGFVLTPPVPTSNETGWADNIWSCMGDWMSGSYQTSDPFLATYGILLIVLVALVILGIAGLAYFYLFPEIRNMPRLQPPQVTTTQPSQNASMSSYESVLKTLNEDERKVLNVLKNHGGTYLQKYIRDEAGLSRLKTHRVLARFAERGMVTLEKSGNTNEVTLADWLK